MKKSLVFVFLWLVTSLIVTGCSTATTTVPTATPLPPIEISFAITDAGVAQIHIHNPGDVRRLHVEVFKKEDSDIWISVLNINDYSAAKGLSIIEGKWVTSKSTVLLKLVVRREQLDYQGKTFSEGQMLSSEQDGAYHFVTCDDNWWYFEATKTKWGTTNQWGLGVYVDDEVPFLTFADAEPGEVNWLGITVPPNYSSGWQVLSLEYDRSASYFFYEDDLSQPTYCKK